MSIQIFEIVQEISVKRILNLCQKQRLIKYPMLI